MADPLLQIADELYGLPPGEFTAARDARARELKADPATRELAQRVKALRRPSVPAWAVNLLVRREAEQVDQVLRVGEALREAQAGLDAGQLRELTRQRRALTSAVTSRARALLADAGQRMTQSVADQVEGTLTAAMVDEGAADAVRSGLLVAALSTTGVDAAEVAPALAVPEALGFAATPRVAPAPEPPELHVVADPDADAKARRAAEQALAEAEQALAERESLAGRAARLVTELEARCLERQAGIDEARRRLADLESALEDTEEELSDAEDERDGTRAAVAEAERAVQQARAALESLDG